MANVQSVEHGDGSVSIGLELEGVYVPFAQVSGARIAGLQERAANLAERVEANPDDKAALEALSTLPTSVPKASRGKGKGNGEADGEGA